VLIGFLVECGSLVFVSCGIIMGMVAAWVVLVFILYHVCGVLSSCSKFCCYVWWWV